MNARSSAQPLLRAESLSVAFGGVAAVSDLSFEVGAGEIVGLVGPNGAGKTTCFNMLTGFCRPTTGRVDFDGRDITRSKPHVVARLGLVRTFQKTNVLKALSVFENVLAGHYWAARQSLFDTFFPRPRVAQAENAARDSAAAIIERIGLAGRRDAPAYLLSCGELRLLEVAVAVAAKPVLLMLDEPAAGLNSHEAAAFGLVLKGLVGPHVRSVLLVEHNMSLVMAVSDRVIVMNQGRKLAEGAPAEVIANPAVVEAYLGRAAA